MAWIRIDDGFADQPNVIMAGPEAAWLYVCGLCYAARHQTDGFVPAGKVPQLVEASGAEALAAKLVAVGLWEAAEGGYRIPDVLAVQPRPDRTRVVHTSRPAPGRRLPRRTISAAQQARHSPDYADWRTTVLARDGHRCQDCGADDAPLHAHHIKPWSDHPDLRFDPANGQTLCAPCHTARHRKGVMA